MALDMRGRAVVFDSTGAQINRSSTLPVRAIEDAAVLNDTIVVVAGIIAGSGVELTSPRLLTVAGGRAFFMDPESELPNHWVAATLH